MVLRMLYLLVLFTYGIADTSANAKNETAENKSKRGIFNLSDSNYPVLPLHQLTRYSQVRALSEDPSAGVDITYKQYEDIKPQSEHSAYSQQSYDYGDALKASTNNYKVNEPSQFAQSPYGGHHYSNPIGQQTIKTHDHLAVPSQHLAAPQFSSYFGQKIGSPLQFYGSDKQLALPTSIKPASEIKISDYLDSYSPIPIIYGQPSGALPSLKYIQPLTKSQYNLPSTFGSLPLQNTYQSYKVPAKLQVAPFQQQRSLQGGFKPIQSSYYQPQSFDNPIVPQLQHFIPSIQSPFDAFTKPAPIVAAKPTQPPPKKEQLKQESDDDEEEEDDEEHENREEPYDEEEFERGYDEAARDFQRHHDDDDEYRRVKYHDDDDDRYERHRGRYEAEYDDDHKGHYSTNKEHRKPHDHDEKRGRYSERDHESHHSSKSSKKKPKKHYKESAYESAKYYNRDDSDKSPSKKPVHYSKYYKSSSKKPQSDSRYVSSTPKKLAVKKPTHHQKESASTKSEVEFKPNYEYGFEPLKINKDNAKVRELDSVAKSSEPSQSKKLYKENWYYSKSSKSQ